MDTPQQYPTMWTTGYIGNVKISFTFPIRNEMDAYAQAKAITDKLIADGFRTEAPGLEAGEQKEPMGWVLRREKDDGTPVIDLYKASERYTFRYVMCYLDTAEDIKAFQDATGLDFNKLPLYVGDRLERDGKEKSKKYIIPVTRSANAVIKDNPDYNPEETDVKKKKPARLFIRWDAGSEPTPPTATAPASAAAQPEASRVSELVNEALTITRVEPRTDSTGWYGYGMFDDGVGSHEVRVNLFAPEDPKAITDAGYKWATSGAVNWSVILAIKDNRTRIGSVVPNQTERTWDADAWLAVLEYCAESCVLVKDVLGVDRGSQWKRGYNAAIKAIDTYVAKHSANVDFMAEMPKASGQ